MARLLGVVGDVAITQPWVLVVNDGHIADGFCEIGEHVVLLLKTETASLWKPLLFWPLPALGGANLICTLRAQNSARSF